MTAQSKITIKSYFETGDRPTQGQFEDLVDSYLDYDASLSTLTSAATGIVAKASAGGFASRTIEGIANEISVSAGNGATNPTISLPAAITLVGKTLTGGTIVSASLTSPDLTGIPTAPTAASATNTTQLATTAFVQQELNSDSGIYTPTITLGANLSGVAAGDTFWIRRGDIVSLGGSFSVSQTGTAAFNVLISLPVASNLGAITDATGTQIQDANAAALGLVVNANTGNDAINLAWTGGQAGTRTIYWTAFYRII